MHCRMNSGALGRLRSRAYVAMALSLSFNNGCNSGSHRPRSLHCGSGCCDSSCIGPVTGAGSSHQQLGQARQLLCNASWHALAHAVTARSQLRSVQFSCALTRALGVAYSVAAPVHLTTFSSSSDRDAPRRTRHGIRRHGTTAGYVQQHSRPAGGGCGSVCLRCAMQIDPHSVLTSSTTAPYTCSDASGGPHVCFTGCDGLNMIESNRTS